MMKTASSPSRLVKTLRLIARIWSILVFGFALLEIFTPDPYATGRISLRDIILLSFWGVAIIGLLIAWKWELVGGMITIFTMFLREIVWIVLTHTWIVNFLLIWLLLIPPAILFILCWSLDRRAKNQPSLQS